MATTIICTPEFLMDAAKCYKCIPTGMQREVLIWLLATMAGGSMDPNDLMESARCMKCIPTGMQDEVIASLLCQLANATPQT